MAGWSIDTITTVNELIMICESGALDFYGAIPAVAGADVQAFFSQCAAERRSFAAMLKMAARRAGLRCEPYRNASGAIRIVSHDPFVVLHAVAVKERRALRAYGTALAEREVPTDVRKLIRLQYQRIEQVYERVIALCRDAGPPPSELLATGDARVP